MDTLVTVQKLFQLRALIPGSSLSSGDVLVKPTKEPHSVPGSSVIELGPKDIRIFSTLASPQKSVHSTSQDPIPRATIAVLRSFFRTSSRYSSSRPSRMFEFSSKDELKVKNQDMSVRSRKRSPSRPSTAPGRWTKSGTIWTNQDSYLPRAKPPPPLKHIKHARNRSEHSVTPDSSSPPSTQCGSSGPSRSTSSASLSPRRSFDIPPLERPRECGSKPATHPLRQRRRATTLTDFQEPGEKKGASMPFDYNWEPPTNWAGPSRADKDSRSKLLGWFTRRKGPDSSAESTGSTMSVPRRLSRTRSFKKMKIIHSPVTREQREENSVVRENPLPPGVVVSIHCHEGDAWHEKSMADIIPKLRQLKVK